MERGAEQSLDLIPSDNIERAEVHTMDTMVGVTRAVLRTKSWVRLSGWRPSLYLQRAPRTGCRGGPRVLHMRWSMHGAGARALPSSVSPGR